MKQLKLSAIIILLFAVLIIPSVALASWWNPLSWHWDIFNWFSKPQMAIIRPSQTANPAAAWGSYGNGQYGYAIQFPSDWAFREYPDAKTGAGFRPLSTSDQISNEFINVDWKSRGTDNCATPFADYVKIAAGQEIESYGSLHSIKTVITNSGEVGYETTWNFSQGGVSLPITYFYNDAEKCGDVEISLGNASYAETYNQMISTFKFTS